MKERIQKVLANAGIASRRSIEEMIRQGRVSVNGRIVYELPVLIDPEKDKVAIDDELVRFTSRRAIERIYILLYKPKDVYTTNIAQGEQTRAIDLLPPGTPRVYPVGRLDSEAKGLLLLTNDGELTNQLTHPRYGVSKTYRALVDGYITGESVQEMQQGIWMSDPRSGKGYRTGRSRIKIVSRSRDKSVIEVTLLEGRNPQVRRMLARIGHKVRELTRIKMGPLTLKGLSPGDSRLLLAKEIRELKQLGEKHEEGEIETERASVKTTPSPVRGKKSFARKTGSAK